MAAPSCDYNSYPLEPTFCDDWCRATLRADCERGFSLDRCESELRALTNCYSQASADGFTCSPVGTSVAKPQTCEAERDTWLACEAPDVHECVKFCRPIREQGVEFLGEECPELLPVPGCEDLCWSGVRLEEESTEAILNCFLDVLTRCEPVSRPGTQSLREYCEDAVKAGRYGAAGAGGGGAGPM